MGTTGCCWKLFAARFLCSGGVAALPAVHIAFLGQDHLQLPNAERTE